MSGNGEDYKRVPNSEKTWEIDAYPKLLSEIRTALGTDKLISAAVPGLQRDMIAFGKDNLPKIAQSVEFLNIMTYDLMNRRDSFTKHHTGLEACKDAIQAYLANGLPEAKVVLGFAFYVKWFKTDANGGCDTQPIGCKTALMEDEQGNDLGQAGAFAWHDEVPSDLSDSFEKAMKMGRYDERSGGHYFWDGDNHIFWSWDTPEAMHKKYATIVQGHRLGGVFAWGLGEDGPEWEHLQALTAEVQQHSYGSVDYLQNCASTDESSNRVDHGRGMSQEKEEL